MCTDSVSYTVPAPALMLPQTGVSLQGRQRQILWDERVATVQQTVEMKQNLRLSRIEQECARIRRPAKPRGVSRPVLRMVNSCPAGRYDLLKDMGSIQDRFEWLRVDTERSEVFCAVCVSRVGKAPVNLTKFTKSDTRWRLLSPRGRSLVPNVESHAFSSIHAWAAAVQGSEKEN